MSNGCLFGDDWVVLTFQKIPLGFEEVLSVLSVVQEFRKVLPAPWDGVVLLFVPWFKRHQSHPEGQAQIQGWGKEGLPVLPGASPSPCPSKQTAMRKRLLRRDPQVFHVHASDNLWQKGTC